MRGVHSRNACGEGVGGQRTFCCPSTTSPHSEAPAASEPSQAQQRSRVSPHCSAACPTREYRGGVYPTHSSAVVRASICTFSNSCGETLSFHPPFTSTATSRDGCSDAAFESPGSPGGDGAGAAAKWRRMRVSPAICATVSTVTPSWGHRHRAMRGSRSSSSSRHENVRRTHKVLQSTVSTRINQLDCQPHVSTLHRQHQRCASVLQCHNTWLLDHLARASHVPRPQHTRCWALMGQLVCSRSSSTLRLPGDSWPQHK